MFKPMLAPIDSPKSNPRFFEKLRYPLYVSPKLDGIRCLPKDAPEATFTADLTMASSTIPRLVCKSRKFLDLPSRQVQRMFSRLQELDGEVICGDETAFDVYNVTQSYVMSENKEAPEIYFRVFDSADMLLCNDPFFDRLEYARSLLEQYRAEFGEIFASIVEHELVEDYEELIACENKWLAAGYEGIMMRDPVGRYKHNRGTFNEGLIYKLKRFQDDEGIVVGFEEGKTNLNEKVRDELGNAKRSTARDGMVAAGTLGKLLVDFRGDIIKVAPGAMKHPERVAVWESWVEFGEKSPYLGRYSKFRHFAHGVKDKPRFPRHIGWRDPMDFGEMR